MPIETVEELFPDTRRLDPGLRAHFLESLQLPPADRAPDIFAGASSEADRVRRLVETLFGVYERGAAGLTVGRRERDEVPAVDESMEELDGSLDALVAEAMRPLHADSASVTSLRALTDLEVWRTIRDQGATPDSAVDHASAAVGRWLAARPTRRPPPRRGWASA